MHLNGVQLIFKICLIISMSSQIGLTIGDKCGKYGFNCLNKRYYQQCGGCSKITTIPRKIYVCPPNSICNEECPNPCPTPCPDNCPKSQLEMIAQAKQSQEDREISQILTTEMTKPPRVPCKGRPRLEQSSIISNKNFEPFRQMGSMDSYSPKKRIYQPKSTTINIKTHKKKVKSMENIKNNILSVRSLADLFKKASGEKKEKPADEKGDEKKKAEEEKHTAKAKHAKAFASREGDAESDYSTKEKFSTDHDDDEAKFKSDEVNSIMRESGVDEDSATKKSSENEHFLCPGVGSFPSRNEDTCFYVCYRARRSTSEELRAIKVCCPDNMFFDKKSHKCCDRKLKLKSSQKYLKKMYRRRSRKKRRQLKKHKLGRF